jgi:hypothetical protein
MRKVRRAATNGKRAPMRPDPLMVQTSIEFLSGLMLDLQGAGDVVPDEVIFRALAAVAGARRAYEDAGKTNDIKLALWWLDNAKTPPPAAHVMRLLYNPSATAIGESGLEKIPPEAWAKAIANWSGRGKRGRPKGDEKAASTVFFDLIKSSGLTGAGDAKSLWKITSAGDAQPKKPRFRRKAKVKR